jgi:hypothetical protein
MLVHEVTCLMSVGVISLVFGQVSLSLSLDKFSFFRSEEYRKSELE